MKYMSAQSGTQQALKWIIGILEQRSIPFQITGGLAARVYGSSRPLNDIDIDVADERLTDIIPDVREYIEYGPAHYHDERWDLQLMTLNYHGQQIDIGGARNVRICDIHDGKWKNNPADISRAEIHEIFGIRVPVVEKSFLANYKQMLQGEHQAVDVQAVLQSMNSKMGKLRAL